MRVPVPIRSTPNLIALAVTALAAVAITVWSSVPMSGTWEYPLAGGGRPSLRHPVSFDGFSGPEPWGRWTTDDRATMTFGRVFPRRFLVVLRGHASAPNVGAPVRVCAGPVCETARFDGVPTEVRLRFSGGDGRTLTFHIPHPTAPGPGDTRRLGIGLTAVRIEELGR